MVNYHHIKHKIFVGLLFLLITLPLPCFAWNYTGHVVIAQIAYDNLNPEVQKRADVLANIIYRELSLSEQQKLDYKYANASTFAKIAELPDEWRQWHFGTILNAFDAPPPINMLWLVNDSTQAWHYINLPYPANKICPISSPNVVWAITQIEKGLKNTNNNNTRAVLMVLEEHYIGDVHQPLHTITATNNTCVSDEGGNDFCIRYSAKTGKCTKNLHALWDSAVGYLKPHENIQAIAHDIETNYPPSRFNQTLLESNPTQWANDNYRYAAFIYSLAQGQKPSPAYYQQGQIIAKQQMALAGYRLAEVFDQMFSFNRQSMQ